MLTFSFCSYGDDDEEMTGGLPPPRLFCDICDVFDEHDTDDCPLQTASDSPQHSMHHGKRAPGGSDRPYCDNCEGTKWGSLLYMLSNKHPYEELWAVKHQLVIMSYYIT